MSQRDQRFRPLMFSVNDDNSIFTAKGVDRTYYIVKMGDLHYQVLGTGDSEFDAAYVWLKDARSVCQIHHENLLKEWMA